VRHSIPARADSLKEGEEIMTKKYVVTLFGEKQDDEIHYRSTIHPLSYSLLGRIVLDREYKDECEMVQVVNSVLPVGDIR